MVRVTARTSGTAGAATSAARATRATGDGRNVRACRATTSASGAAVACTSGCVADATGTAGAAACQQVARYPTGTARTAVSLPGACVVRIAAGTAGAGEALTERGSGGHASGTSLATDGVAGAVDSCDGRTTTAPVAGMCTAGCEAAGTSGSTECTAGACRCRRAADAAGTSGRVAVTPAGAAGTTGTTGRVPRSRSRCGAAADPACTASGAPPG